MVGNPFRDRATSRLAMQSFRIDAIAGSIRIQSGSETRTREVVYPFLFPFFDFYVPVSQYYVEVALMGQFLPLVQIWPSICLLFSPLYHPRRQSSRPGVGVRHWVGGSNECPYLHNMQTQIFTRPPHHSSFSDTSIACDQHRDSKFVVGSGGMQSGSQDVPNLRERRVR
jgi:hypothetical protein